jgi:hypothetical protein
MLLLNKGLSSEGEPTKQATTKNEGISRDVDENKG